MGRPPRLLCCLFLALSLAAVARAATRHHEWEISYQFRHSDCVRKLAVTINGETPGPTIRAVQGDTVVVRVKNSLLTENVAIHWHGIRQIGTPWADGTEGVTQCPVLPGDVFTYAFVVDRPGTNMYHAHYGMQRSAGLNGFIVVAAAPGGRDAEPFTYDGEHEVLLNDWWHKSTHEQAAGLASAPIFWVGEPQSQLINGRGRFANCSNMAAGACNAAHPECATQVFAVVPGKTDRGPTIRAVQGDTVVVRVKNSLLTENVAIHWHGIRQIGTPWADGTEGVTQCPVLPGDVFTYAFVVDRPVTYMYHAHYGMQRSAGLNGLIVVAAAPGGRDAEPFAYDGEHEVLLNDWWHKSTHEQAAGLASAPIFWVGEPQSLLINGRGRFANCSNMAAGACNAAHPECATQVFAVVPAKTDREPTIRAVQGDTVVVRVKNSLRTENVAIHWHGIRQISTPWADGTEGVTQCPVLPGDVFTYAFVVDRPGTYMYHAHYGMQRSAGLNGLIVVAAAPGGRDAEPFAYDGEHEVLLNDWWHKSTHEQAAGLASAPIFWVGEPQSLLINGRGRFANCSNMAAGVCNAAHPECATQVFAVVPAKTDREPTIRAVQGDTVVVRVKNSLRTENVAIHWHGIRQIGTPWADGTEGVTPCPVLPGDVFTYAFVVDRPGTYMYHAHYGMQRSVGLNGLIVVAAAAREAAIAV